MVSLDNLSLDAGRARERAARLLKRKTPASRQVATAASDLRTLAQDADNDRPINWSVVAKFVEITPAYRSRSAVTARTSPASSARTASWRTGERCLGPDRSRRRHVPDIKLYDFRVLAKTLEDTEFAIIAALQYIRYLNERHTFTTIHGANLSLSIPHDVRNFACGRTPICNECERLVESGVVVVAAAGNLGYHSFETKDGSYEGYTAFSITDPGNADGVITVGATHRFWPHTYGVSFFSSRGPTGDGRMKPDLVAPGERIQSCLPGQGWGELDGTSMAAPHVSGAAAMLMARYSELIGQPRRIKRILVRERDGSRSRAQLPGPRHARRAPGIPEDLRLAMIFSLDVRRARKGDCLLLHYGTSGRSGLAADRRRTVAGLRAAPASRGSSVRSATGARARPAERSAASRPADGQPHRRRSHQRHPRADERARRGQGRAEAAAAEDPRLLAQHVRRHHRQQPAGTDARRSPLQFGAARSAGEPDTEGLDQAAAMVLASVAAGHRLRDDVTEAGAAA